MFTVGLMEHNSNHAIAMCKADAKLERRDKKLSTG